MREIIAIGLISFSIALAWTFSTPKPASFSERWGPWHSGARDSFCYPRSKCRVA